MRAKIEEAGRSFRHNACDERARGCRTADLSMLLVYLCLCLCRQHDLPHLATLPTIHLVVLLVCSGLSPPLALFLIILSRL